MKSPLPTQEVQAILGKYGFVRLYGQEEFLYISDAPRRVASETILLIQKTMQEQGFTTAIGETNLLLIDLQPDRWETLFNAFPHTESFSMPEEERLLGVYALARLLARHPAPLNRQPMVPFRAVLKRYDAADGLPALAPRLQEQCAQWLRQSMPLPAALADVLFTWLQEQKEERA